MFSKETKSEICIGITNDMIVEFQLLGCIELNECNLDYTLGVADVRLIWFKAIFIFYDKMKNVLALSRMQQLMKSKS